MIKYKYFQIFFIFAALFLFVEFFEKVAHDAISVFLRSGPYDFEFTLVIGFGDCL